MSCLVVKEMLFLECCLQDIFNVTSSVLVYLLSSFYFIHFVNLSVEQGIRSLALVEI